MNAKLEKTLRFMMADDGNRPDAYVNGLARTCGCSVDEVKAGIDAVFGAGVNESAESVALRRVSVSRSASRRGAHDPTDNLCD